MLSIAERHKYILERLEKYGFIRITDVAEELGVTKVTIRKDVKILEDIFMSFSYTEHYQISFLTV